MRPSLALAALLLALHPATAPGETVRATRLVVSDHAEGRVSVHDARTGETLLRHDLDAPARINHGTGPGELTLLQGPQGRVWRLRTGFRLEPHGDHHDLHLDAPSVNPEPLTGQRPAHVAARDGRVAVFFDGDGLARLWRDGDDRPPETVRAAHPHHGVAFPYASPEGGRVALSKAPGPGQPPDHLRILDSAGREVGGSEPCPRLHGEARSGPWIAFGCLDGVLLVDTRDSTSRKIANPEGAGSRAVRNLAGGEDWQLFVGDFGPDGMAVADPGEPVLRPIDLPARRLHFTLDPAAAETVFVLTEDGVLRTLSTLDGSERRSAEVTGRYPLEGGAAVARPRLSAAGGLVAVSDPARGRVLVLDAATLAVAREIETGGRPFDLRLVHVAGERH